jgi:hypothetical protein
MGPGRLAHLGDRGSIIDPISLRQLTARYAVEIGETYGGNFLGNTTVVEHGILQLMMPDPVIGQRCALMLRTGSCNL